MSKADRIATLEAEVVDLRAEVRACVAHFERMDADRKTFVRHQHTLGRHLRRALNDNRELRIAIKTVFEQRDMLIQHIAKIAPAGSGD